MSYLINYMLHVSFFLFLVIKQRYVLPSFHLMLMFCVVSLTETMCYTTCIQRYCMYLTIKYELIQLLPECKIRRKGEYNYYLNVRLGEKVSTIIT
jgi:hypothetical protein